MNHCSVKGGCGQHFRGMAAFEKHLKRVREFKNEHGAPEYELRHLSGPEAGLQAVTGNCEFEDAESITIWRMPLTEEQIAALRRIGKEEEE